MNPHKLALFLLLSAMSVGVPAQEEEMTLQQQRDRMGAEMEERRQQIGRDINRIREPGTPRDAFDRRPSVPGNPNPPAGTPLPGDPTNGSGIAPPPGTPPLPATPSGANGNVGPGSGTSPGGIGTGGGNGGAAASPDGGAATGGPTGGAAGRP